MKMTLKLKTITRQTHLISITSSTLKKMKGTMKTREPTKGGELQRINKRTITMKTIEILTSLILGFQLFLETSPLRIKDSFI